MRKVYYASGIMSRVDFIARMVKDHFSAFKVDGRMDVSASGDGKTFILSIDDSEMSDCYNQRVRGFIDGIVSVMGRFNTLEM